MLRNFTHREGAAVEPDPLLAEEDAGPGISLIAIEPAAPAAKNDHEQRRAGDVEQPLERKSHGSIRAVGE